MFHLRATGPYAGKDGKVDLASLGLEGEPPAHARPHVHTKEEKVQIAHKVVRLLQQVINRTPGRQDFTMLSLALAYADRTTCIVLFRAKALSAAGL